MIKSIYLFTIIDVDNRIDATHLLLSLELILLLLSDSKSHRLAAANFHDSLRRDLPRANHSA